MSHLAGTGSAPVAGLAAQWLWLRARLDLARDERGMTTETVIITAGLAVLAVTVVAIIAARVSERANQIP
jgi:hypothetical protein